jgi:hypothetical protein
MMRAKVVKRVRKITCYDCGKTYDYDVDDFCPRCGAFTQPIRQSRIDAQGDVVRVEGINEVNHKGSFVHAELHKENRRRKGTALEVESIRTSGRKPSTKKQSAGRQIQITPPLGGTKQAGKKEDSSGSFLGTVILVIIVVLVKALLN